MDATLYTLGQNRNLLKVHGGAAPVGIQPLHIIALIDTSGSMEIEDRLENVKRSLHFMFPMLGIADLVSLISFDEYSQIHVQAQQMTPDGLMHCQQALAAVHIGTATNMSAGLTNARTCIAATPASHKPALMILTDGEVNRGIRDVAALTNMVRDLRTSHNTLTVYSTGYGLQHNAGLLTELATEGNGSYTIVQNQEHVAAVFGDILGGLLSCVAQNVEIIMPADARPATRFRVLEVAGLKRVQFGDIYAETEQVLVIEGEGSVTISYLTTNGETKTLVPVVQEADEAVRQEAVITELRLKAADVLAAGRAAGEETIRSLLEQVRNLATSWAPIVIPELDALLVPLPPPIAMPFYHHLPSLGAMPGLAPTVSGAQQAAVLRMGRGLISQTVSASEDDPLNTGFIMPDGTDPIAIPPPPPIGPPGLSQCFSSPTQRSVTSRLRQISSSMQAAAEE